MVSILTNREYEIINKKIKGLSLSQNESNILSKSVRPKLKEISRINASTLLNSLEYNQMARSIENKISKLISRNMKSIQALVIFGSAVQTNYKSYRDIDLLIITKKRIWKSTRDKYNIIMNLTNLAKDAGLNLDIQIIDKSSFYSESFHNPSLIYQLKECRVIYGAIKILPKTELSKLDLRMKLDWSDIDDEESNGREIYQSFRNIILVRLLLQRIVDNKLLRENVARELGELIIAKLKNNTASMPERKRVLRYIHELSEKTDKEIREAPWEKIAL